MEKCIKLLVNHELGRPVIRAWFNCVSENAPSGIVNPVTVEDDDHDRHVVRLIHQVLDHRHAYVVPLTRNLRESEIEHVATQFSKVQPDLDFDIETNETHLRAKDDDVIPLDSAKYLALCTALAKNKHETWLHERSDAGWRYGISFDPAEKTHPLLRPWDQLPERYRTPDLAGPQQLIDLLNDNGYAVVSAEELAKLGHPTVIQP